MAQLTPKRHRSLTAIIEEMTYGWNHRMTYVWWSEYGELPSKPEPPEQAPAAETQPIEYTPDEQLVNVRVAAARRGRR